MSVCSTRVDIFTCLWAAAGLLIVSAGCGSSSTSTAPSAVTLAPAPAPAPTPTPTSHGSIGFKIDGAPVAPTGVTATFANGILAVGGGDSSRNTVLGFAFAPTGPGVYALGPLSAANALLTMGNPAAGWNAAVGIGGGSITLTTLTSAGASGTFTFNLVAVPNTGATGTKAITEGVFNVTF
jgi:hypothetical protein